LDKKCVQNAFGNVKERECLRIKLVWTRTMGCGKRMDSSASEQNLAMVYGDHCKQGLGSIEST
jgi:hypothetical protein